MNKLTRPARTALLVVTVLHCGCAAKVTQMYSGERRPPEEVALVMPWDTMNLLGGYVIRTYVIAVDGQELEKGAAEVLPGRHAVMSGAVLSVGTRTTTFQPENELIVDAKAGHTYQVKAHFFVDAGFYEIFLDREETPPTVWIEDKESGEIVAGEKPE